MKLTPQVIAEIKADMRCQICGRRTNQVCGECQAELKLAGWCELCQEKHKTERMHMALWSVS